MLELFDDCLGKIVGCEKAPKHDNTRDKINTVFHSEYKAQRRSRALKEEKKLLRQDFASFAQSAGYYVSSGYSILVCSATGEHTMYKRTPATKAANVIITLNQERMKACFEVGSDQHVAIFMRIL